MLNTKKVEEVVQSVMKMMPPSLLGLHDDMEKNIRSAMSATFTKLDLVTREEFDIQTQVLHRTREKLETLEAKVAEIEKFNTQRENNV